MATNSNIRLSAQKSIKENTSLQGLRVSGIFAKWPVIGISMFLLGSLLFGALAYGVMTNDALLRWDTTTAQAFNAEMQNVPSSLVEYIIFGFFVGREILVIFGTVLVVYFLYKRFWRELALVLLGPGAGGLLWYFLSRYFDRPRPTTQLQIILDDPSFPSGHALSSLVFYVLLGYLLVPAMPSRFWKFFVVLLLTLLTAFVGLSRLLLGGHYVTDVVAGYAVGLAWVGLTYTLVEKLLPTDGRSPSLIREQSLQPLQTPGLFKRAPLIGVALILLASLSFAALGYDLLNHGWLSNIDLSVHKTLLANAATAPPRVDEIMLFAFFLGKQVLLAMVILLCLYFFHHRLWLEMAMLLIGSAGGNFIWNFFISYFSRPRPTDQLGLEINTIPSFPSGHAMSVIICYGFLAYVLVPRMPSRFWKWTVGITLFLVILFSGFSRLFHGNHYLTDILAGYALGMAWAVLVWTLLENIFWRRKV